MAHWKVQLGPNPAGVKYRAVVQTDGGADIAIEACRKRMPRLRNHGVAFMAMGDRELAALSRATEHFCATGDFRPFWLVEALAIEGI